MICLWLTQNGLADLKRLGNVQLADVFNRAINELQIRCQQEKKTMRFERSLSGILENALLATARFGNLLVAGLPEPLKGLDRNSPWLEVGHWLEINHGRKSTMIGPRA